MPRNMRHISREMVRDIINGTPSDIFDTHWLEQRLLRLHTVAFAEDLLEGRRDVDPLKSFSTAFAQWVDRQFRGDIQQTTKVDSINLVGDPVSNQQWRKTHPETRIT